MLLTAVGVLLAAIAFFSSAMFVDSRLAGAIALVVLAVVAWALFRFLPNQVIYWGKGAEAERRVGAQLDSLVPLGFVTLYDRRVPGRGGNIDALTVGPPGVFVIETKHRGRGVEVIQGRFEVGGSEQQDAIRQVVDLSMQVQISIAQAMNRHRLTVVPIICIGNRGVRGGERAGGVLVLDIKSIAQRLASEPTTLTEADVQEFAGLLDRALPPYERRNP